MWELRLPRPHGLTALRKLMLFAAALAAAVFGYLWLASPTVAAADATWKDDTVVYNGKTFERNNDERLPEMINASQDAAIYQYLNDAGDKVEFIYFPSSDAAGTATSAQHVTYDFSPPNNLSNRDGPRTISVEPRAAPGQEAASSCEVDGIGWIVCPITTFLARGTDWLFNVLSDFLKVPPLYAETDTPLYRTWQMMLGIANLAFVVAFIIIIYSQLTSVGLSNYGIKRMLPRLIIAAVLVNISYTICALAVDASNLLGYNLQNMFIDMRNNIVGEGGNGWQIVSWEDVAVAVLSGGAAVTAGTVAGVVAVSTYGVAGAIFLLLPTLLGVLLSVLVAFLVLAARQALITVLVILAPLAFVAYLLPNTEKWFGKWRDLFMTMLIVFPAFSLLFGGAQLAGTVIIQNARDSGSLTVLILGMATQIAPIVITPFLVRLSGSLLGRIAGMVNNTNKGLIDRTRNFAKDEAEHRRARRTAALMRTPPNRRQLLRRTGRGMEMRRRRREGERAVWQAAGEEGWVDTDDYRRLQDQLERSQHRTETAKQTVSTTVKADIQREINLPNSRLHLENVQLEAAKASLASQTGRTEAQLEEYRTRAVADRLDPNSALGRAVRTIQLTNEDVALQSLRKASADHIRQREFATLLSNEDETSPEFARTQAALTTAAGIDPSGRLRAQSDAMSKLLTLDKEELNKSIQFLNARAIREHTTLKDYTARIANEAMAGVRHDQVLVKAALEQQAREGQVGILEDALASFNVNHEDIMEVISNNIDTLKEKGGFHIQAEPSNLSIQTIAGQLRSRHPSWTEDAIRRAAQAEFNKKMAYKRLSTLAETSATNITSFKDSYFKNRLAPNMSEYVDLARQYASEHPEERINIEKVLEDVFYNIHSISSHEDLRVNASQWRDELTLVDETFQRKGVRLVTPAKEAERSRREEKGS